MPLIISDELLLEFKDKVYDLTAIYDNDWGLNFCGWCNQMGDRVHNHIEHEPNCLGKRLLDLIAESE